MPRRSKSETYPDDNPRWTPEDLTRAIPFFDQFPHLEAEHSKKRKRGAQKAATKQLISLRLSRDVVAALRASGPGWQARADDVLRAATALARPVTEA